MQWPWSTARNDDPSSAMPSALLESLFTMAAMVEARDPYTGGHLWRVSQYSARVAAAVGLVPEEVFRTALGGFLHDLGKVAVPDSVLLKPGPLTTDETLVMRTHPAVGADLIADHPLGHAVEQAVRHHHERIDGGGYPDGLSGDGIAVSARVVSVCDALDAMTSHRPYRSPMTMDRALGIIHGEAGRQFDPDCAAAVVELGRNGAFDVIHGHTDEGIPLHECPMCGPTVVVRREQAAGDSVYCPQCRAEAVLERDKADGTLRPCATGRHGDPGVALRMPDTALIRRLITQPHQAGLLDRALS